jgi:hypothetical protein
MRKLTLSDIEEARWGHGTSALLFITDRCPVGCAHCSVDSRADSPRITDFVLFENIVAGLAATNLEMVGISGGEPFVERRALPYAVRQLRNADKDVVVYTSGFWAVTSTPAEWIRDIIQQCGCIFLSTDAFHQAEIGNERFINAARVIAAENIHIIVQVVDFNDALQRAGSLLRFALGSEWDSLSELNLVPPLPYGRARNLFTRSRRHRGDSFGTCRLAKAPVVRYDGLVTGCCNESVLLGGGPAWLRRRVSSAVELDRALTAFRDSPLLQTISGVGVGELTRHPRAGDAAIREYGSICGACWLCVNRLASDSTDNLLTSMAALGKENPS